MDIIQVGAIVRLSKRKHVVGLTEKKEFVVISSRDLLLYIGSEFITFTELYHREYYTNKGTTHHCFLKDKIIVKVSNDYVKLNTEHLKHVY